MRFAREKNTSRSLLALTICLYCCCLSCAPPPKPTRKSSAIKGLPESQVMAELLNQYRGMEYEELCRNLQNPVDFVEELSFDPAQAEYFDLIRTKLKTGLLQNQVNLSLATTWS
jgi:hypothetical protein